MIDFKKAEGLFDPSTKVTDYLSDVPIQDIINLPDHESLQLKNVLSKSFNIGVDNICVGNGSMELLMAISLLQKKQKNLVVVPTYDGFFDAIICIYDSINHLKKISDWDRTFKRVKKHLKQGGVFIFDMNTLRKLNDLSNKPTTVSYFEDNIMLLKVTKEKPSIFNWNLKIFEEYKKEKNRLHEENIKETSFPIKKIKKILSNYFSNISIIDSKMRVASENSDRVYFICK